MFSVLEYNLQDGSFIGHTFYVEGKKAVKLGRMIVDKYKNIKVIVTQLDYNAEGLLWECVIWNSQRQEDYNV